MPRLPLASPLPSPPPAVDSVLLPARSIQTVTPYSQAAPGATAAATKGGALATDGSGGGGGGGPGGGSAQQQPECYNSVAEALAATPELQIFSSTLGLSGVRPAVEPALLAVCANRLPSGPAVEPAA